MASEMSVSARFPASCLGFASPGSALASAPSGNAARTGPRRSVRPMRHFRAAPPQQSGSAGKAERERQGLVHKANGLVGS